MDARPPKRMPPLWRSPRFLIPAAVFTVFIVAAAGVYAWYFLIRPCDVHLVEEASMLLVRQRDRYDHTYQFATSASQDAIIRPVAELQQILMDTQEVAVPACMQTAKNELIDYMGTVIHAFQAFGAQEEDSAVRDLIDQSEAHYDNFRTEVEAVRACAPLCIP